MFKDYVKKNLVCILNETEKNNVLTELLELISKAIDIKDISKIREGVLHRESLMSTGLGLGIGVPHIRSEEINDLVVAIGVSRAGIDNYESIDDTKIKIVIMILAGVGQHRQYIKLLSLIFSNLKKDNIIKDLTEAKNADEIYSILTEEK